MSYKKVILKLSGEAFSGPDSFGFDYQKINEIVAEIKSIYSSKIKIGIVVGAGNIFRARMIKKNEISRVDADQMGMMATILNAVYLKNILNKQNVKAVVLSNLTAVNLAENFNQSLAEKYWQENKVLIFSGGTGNPYFTTDTSAVLKALEMKADAVFKLTQVEGVYDSDPEKNPRAKMFDFLKYQEALTQRLNVMDMTAFALARDNNLEIRIFKLKKGNLKKVLENKKIGTLLKT